VDNHALSGFLDTSNEWITTRTGISERKVLSDESLLDLAARASQAALDAAGVRASELDLILCATVSGDTIIPALACQIQREIGASCPAFDLNAACSGFVYALDVAAAYFARKPDIKVLVVAAEAMSRLLDWEDRSTCVLFGDGAGAAVLGAGDALRSIQLTAKGDDSTMRVPGVRSNSPYEQDQGEKSVLFMQGQEVYRFVVNTIVGDLRNVIADASLLEQDIDLVVLHQANARIMDAAANRLHIPRERFASNIQSRGNTSAASIPILLDELWREGRLAPGMTLALCAFGGGLTTGACVLQWQAQSPSVK
jgi:3-oxoacyl-[acyl-carrier-protein] synthase-3